MLPLPLPCCHFGFGLWYWYYVFCSYHVTIKLAMYIMLCYMLSIHVNIHSFALEVEVSHKNSQLPTKNNLDTSIENERNTSVPTPKNAPYPFQHLRPLHAKIWHSTCRSFCVVQGGERVGLWGRNKRKVVRNGGRQTPNPSTQTQKKTHTTLFFFLSPIQRTFERPLHRTQTHPISHPLTLTPTRAHKWSTREEKDKKLFRSPLFRLFFSRYNNSSYFSVFFYIQNININLYLCIISIFDKDQLPIKRQNGFWLSMHLSLFWYGTA
jgi:hypothetical protein